MVGTRGKRALPPEGAARGVFDDHVGRATRGRRPCRLPKWRMSRGRPLRDTASEPAGSPGVGVALRWCMRTAGVGLRAVCRENVITDHQRALAVVLSLFASCRRVSSRQSHPAGEFPLVSVGSGLVTSGLGPIGRGGRGGITATSRATGVARSTIGRGLKNLSDPNALTE